MSFAAPAISLIVSFFTRRPAKIAAVITGDTSPRMNWRIRSTISSWKISRCSMERWRAFWGVMGMGMVRDWGVGAGGWGLGTWGWGSELEFGSWLIDSDRHSRESGNAEVGRAH